MVVPPNEPINEPSGERVARDTPYWAPSVSRLSVSEIPTDAVYLNVEGRQVVGPIQGFGKMWQKTYRVQLVGTAVTPAEVIKTWKEHFADFWPRGNRFHAPLTGLAPGEVALISLAMPGHVKLSTGVFVLYADDESFTLMTPQGHAFSGWITFSAHEEPGGTVAQAQVLMRANDPLYEVGLTLAGHRRENAFWEETLRSLAKHLGLEHPEVETRTICIDERRQWSKAGNVRHNAFIRSGIYTVSASLRRSMRPVRRIIVRLKARHTREYPPMPRE
ncbi:MAG: hypothetical protein ACRDJW_23930 [Thermomicrobiales bacterium]